jgi:hypothetical protein
MTPVDHARSSVTQWGGVIEDYLPIHNWFDETKQYTGDFTHRAMRHHAAGVEWCIEKFGNVISVVNDSGECVKVPVKLIAERHVTEDCGRVPTVQDWLVPVKKNPEKWMLAVKTKTVHLMQMERAADGDQTISAQLGASAS